MIGRQVKHKSFGLGTIIGCEAGRITVDFSGTKRLFQFPEAFERFLTTDDAVLHNLVADAFRKKTEARQKAEEELQKAKEAEQAKMLRAAQAYSDVPFPVSANPLPSKKQLLGTENSIAFKCNFCDGGSSETRIGFCGKCSDWMIHYNIEKAKHVWCSTGSICKKYYDMRISRKELDDYVEPNGEYTACYESDLFDKWKMYAGIYQNGERAGKSIRMTKVDRGGLAVLTTRRPSDREQDRFIFAVYMVDSAFRGDDKNEGWVSADPVWRIELAPGQAEKILFWKYYFNRKKTDKIVFGSGLYRYLTDIESAQILRDIAIVKDDDFSKAFFIHFCEVHGIEPGNLVAPSGALMI